MYIEPLVCEGCKKQGRLDDFKQIGIDCQKPELVVHCECGHRTAFNTPHLYRTPNPISMASTATSGFVRPH